MQRLQRVMSRVPVWYLGIKILLLGFLRYTRTE